VLPLTFAAESESLEQFAPAAAVVFFLTHSTSLQDINDLMYVYQYIQALLVCYRTQFCLSNIAYDCYILRHTLEARALCVP